MNVVLLARDELAADGTAQLRDRRAAHIRTVLRAMPGSEIRIGVIDGPLGSGRVTAIGPDFVDLACAFDAEPPPRPQVDLLLALPRPKVMKRLWPQLAALGVDRILLVNATRVERNYFDSHVIDPAFFTALLIEGLQQARDTRLPRVSVHRRLKPLIERELSGLSDAPERVALHPDAPHPLLEAAGGARVLLAVGPEGGWTPYELELFARHGFRTASLGLRTLRTDTACVAALALAHARRNAAPDAT